MGKIVIGMSVEGAEKERNAEADEDGQCKCGLEGEGTVRRGDEIPRCVQANSQIYRPTHRLGKEAVDEEELTNDHM